MGDGVAFEAARKIIMHPLYAPRSSPWLDLKVFYIRVSNCVVDESAPDHLTLNHIPLSPDTVIEVNGQRSSMHTDRPAALMEVASLQHLSDSFSRGWLNRGAQAMPPVADADLGYSFGSSRSFIDMDPAELFSMRWTTTAPPPESDFEFGLPGGGSGSSDPPSPVLVSARQIIRDGRLLPSEPVVYRRSDAQEHHGDRVVADLPSAPRSSPSSPLYRSAQSTPASLSSCSSGRSAVAGGKRGRSPSSWKILVQYLRFLMPLYRKVRALRRFSGPRPRVAPPSPARASTSSMEWCHGNADTAVRDAILYCKKSSGQDL